MLPDIKSLSREEIEAQFKLWNEPAFRVAQLLDWLYARRATSWEAMSNLPKVLRGKLNETYSLQILELARKQGASDTTQKFLWKLADGAFIESVLIPANPALYGEASDRHTLCISTQVGCAYGCRFCASGLDGWKRNLGVHEIVEQILAVERESCRLQVESSELDAREPKTFNLQPATVNNVVVNVRWFSRWT